MWRWLLGVMACWAWAGCDDGVGGADGDASADTSADTDADTDASVDTSADTNTDTDTDASADTDASGGPRPVQVVVFTHIEDQTPGGPLGSPQSRTTYSGLRARLIEVAERAHDEGVRWVLQPDWKFLEAARLYEDAAMTADTSGDNLFVHLRDVLGVAIDPHSHENGGYNYTDVAWLLEELGVGGSTVIGGHIWDPSLPQFQGWDRFREPLVGEKYPEASWRGDILIGSGTPNHVNDPLVSGVWRPRDRDHYFEDDPAGNIVCVGAWHDGVPGVEALVAARDAGQTPAGAFLTASWNVTPTEILAADGPATIATHIFRPLAALQAAGAIETTDFTTLVSRWREAGGIATIYQP